MIALLSITVPAFGIACLLSHLLAQPGVRFQILDYPNARSLHNKPIPRTGGLAIWVGMATGMVVAHRWVDGWSEFGWIAVSALVVGIVSLIDDRFHVPAGPRLVTHLIAGGILLSGGFILESIGLPGVTLDLPPAVGVAISLLFVVWMTNLYNFMDGMDGFAAGMGLIGFGTFSLLGWWAGEALFAYTSAVIAAASAGFLVFNFPPARIFMGDSGSSALGFLAASLMLWAADYDIFPLWVGVLIFSPFIVDATVTLVRRLLRYEKLWLPHREHYYQRIVQFGWGHRKTVLAEYVLMVACAASGIVAVYLDPYGQRIIIVLSIALYAGIMFAVMELENARTTTRQG